MLRSPSPQAMQASFQAIEPTGRISLNQPCVGIELVARDLGAARDHDGRREVRAARDLARGARRGSSRRRAWPRSRVSCTGFAITPTTGSPASQSAIETPNSGMRWMNSLVPSIGSTIQTRRLREARGIAHASPRRAARPSGRRLAELARDGAVGLEIGRPSPDCPRTSPSSWCRARSARAGSPRPPGPLPRATSSSRSYDMAGEYTRARAGAGRRARLLRAPGRRVRPRAW